jgi:hypothetical protein
LQFCIFELFVCVVVVVVIAGKGCVGGVYRDGGREERKIGKGGGGGRVLIRVLRKWRFGFLCFVVLLFVCLFVFVRAFCTVAFCRLVYFKVLHLCVSVK